MCVFRIGRVLFYNHRIFVDVTEFSQPGLNIYIRPTIVFNNSLPFSVDLAVQNPGYEGKFTAIDSGKEVQVLDADVSKSILRVNVSNKLPRELVWVIYKQGSLV